MNPEEGFLAKVEYVEPRAYTKRKSVAVSSGEPSERRIRTRLQQLITEIGVELFNYSGFIGQSNFDLGSSGPPLAYMRNNVLVRYSGSKVYIISSHYPSRAPP